MIRQWDVDERAPLLHGGPGASAWDAALARYLEQAECPGAVRASPVSEWLLWLLGHAVALAYESDVSTIRAAARTAKGPADAALAVPAPTESAASSGAAPVSPAARASSSGAPPLAAAHSALDHDALAEPVRGLRASLGLTGDAGSVDAGLDECISRLRHVVLPAVAAQEASSASSSSSAEAGRPSAAAVAATTASIASLPPGVATGRLGLDRAVLVLRLLYLGAMREAQDRANDILETVQAFTADPKTDSRLGKVGR